MDKVKSLLKKYYNGETSLEEEGLLRQQTLKEKSGSAEDDMFNFFSKEASTPDKLEESILNAISQKERKRFRIKRNIYKYTSVAAVASIILSIGLFAHHKKQQKINEQFALMERAMYNVSKSIEPEEQEEMLVLWVDDNVEIIIN